ncbi:hypothetical protein ES705_18369 [subsurface metagenome]
MAKRDDLGRLVIHDEIPEIFDNEEAREAHLALGYKFCGGTKQLLSLSEFSARLESEDGLQGYCREFNNEYQEDYRKRRKLEGQMKELQDELDKLGEQEGAEI